MCRIIADDKENHLMRHDIEFCGCFAMRFFFSGGFGMSNEKLLCHCIDGLVKNTLLGDYSLKKVIDELLFGFIGILRNFDENYF